MDRRGGRFHVQAAGQTVTTAGPKSTTTSHAPTPPPSPLPPISTTPAPLSTTDIAGIVVGSLVGGGLLFVLLALGLRKYLLKRKRMKRLRLLEAQAAGNTPGATDGSGGATALGGEDDEEGGGGGGKKWASLGGVGTLINRLGGGNTGGEEQVKALTAADIAFWSVAEGLVTAPRLDAVMVANLGGGMPLSDSVNRTARGGGGPNAQLMNSNNSSHEEFYAKASFDAFVDDDHDAFQVCYTWSQAECIRRFSSDFTVCLPIVVRWLQDEVKSLRIRFRDSLTSLDAVEQQVNRQKALAAWADEAKSKIVMNRAALGNDDASVDHGVPTMTPTVPSSTAGGDGGAPAGGGGGGANPSFVDSMFTNTSLTKDGSNGLSSPSFHPAPKPMSVHFIVDEQLGSLTAVVVLKETIGGGEGSHYPRMNDGYSNEEEEDEEEAGGEDPAKSSFSGHRRGGGGGAGGAFADDMKDGGGGPPSADGGGGKGKHFGLNDVLVFEHHVLFSLAAYMWRRKRRQVVRAREVLRNGKATSSPVPHSTSAGANTNAGNGTSRPSSSGAVPQGSPTSGSVIGVDVAFVDHSSLDGAMTAEGATVFFSHAFNLLRYRLDVALWPKQKFLALHQLTCSQSSPNGGKRYRYIPPPAPTASLMRSVGFLSSFCTMRQLVKPPPPPPPPAAPALLTVRTLTDDAPTTTTATATTRDINAAHSGQGGGDNKNPLANKPSSKIGGNKADAHANKAPTAVAGSSSGGGGGNSNNLVLPIPTVRKRTDAAGPVRRVMTLLPLDDDDDEDEDELVVTRTQLVSLNHHHTTSPLSPKRKISAAAGGSGSASFEDFRALAAAKETVLDLSPIGKVHPNHHHHRGPSKIETESNGGASGAVSTEEQAVMNAVIRCGYVSSQKEFLRMGAATAFVDPEFVQGGDGSGAGGAGGIGLTKDGSFTMMNSFLGGNNTSSHHHNISHQFTMMPGGVASTAAPSIVLSHPHGDGDVSPGGGRGGRPIIVSGGDVEYPPTRSGGVSPVSDGNHKGVRNESDLRQNSSALAVKPLRAGDAASLALVLLTAKQWISSIAWNSRHIDATL